MIKITVELVSANGRERDKLLGVGIISNISEPGGDPRYGDYSVWLSKMAPQDRQAWREGRGRITAEDLQHFFDTDVTHFDREKRGAWDLIYIALRQLVAGRNPEPSRLIDEAAPQPLIGRRRNPRR